MNRLDPEAARRLDGARKQRPGLRQAVGRRFSQAAQLLPQRAVFQHCPLAKGGKESILHLVGRSFRIGQAQDVARIRSFQQKSGNPVREHARLSRAGVGGQPCGLQRIGRIHLYGCGRVHHSTACGRVVAEASHSPNRARWS